VVQECSLRRCAASAQVFLYNRRRTLRALPLLGAAFAKDGEGSNFLLHCPLGEINLLMGK